MKKGYEILLDQTVFYPEGGGQPCDIGTMNRVEVMDVQEKDGEIWHRTREAIQEGTEVTCRIDWERRFDLMQQHSGEHLISGLIHEKYGYNNVGFHMGSETITLDVDGEVPEAVLKEIENIILFWLKLGVSGFRLDAASHLTTQAGNGDEKKGLWILEHMRRLIEQRNPDAILLGEVDVAVEDYRHYFGQGDRLQMVLNFWLNKYLYLSLAQQRAAPVVKALQAMVTPPDGCCFVNWLRNHDELDLEGIGERNKRQVIRTFAPDKSMSVYQRGVRRRLAPMLDGDTRRIALAHAILLALPGVPVMRRDWHG